MSLTAPQRQIKNLRNARIYQMYLAGMTSSEIASKPEINLSDASVRRIIKEVGEEHKKCADASVRQMIEEATGKSLRPTPCPEDCIREAQERELALE